jgi:hypothetical protein
MYPFLTAWGILKFGNIPIVSMTYPRVDCPGDFRVAGVVVDVYPRPPLIGTVPSRSIIWSVGSIFAIFLYQ